MILAREMMRQPYWALNAQEALHQDRPGRCSMAMPCGGARAADA